MSRAQTLAKARAQSRKGPQPKAPRDTGAFLTGKNLTIVLCLLLAVATIALYSPVIRYSFIVHDDRDYVTANPHVQAGLGWSTIRWAFTSTYAANWHPLTWLSHALDYQLFALNPGGHHFDSVLIHALNVVLLFLLLVWVTKRVGPSLLVAALFAVHPINVESVAWVAERKNVLSTLFFLLAIGAYVWYSQKPQWRRYLLVAALFAAGLMAKPMVITLPFVLLLLDYWPLGRMAGSPPSAVSMPQLTVSRLLLEKMPLLVLSAASAWITLVAQRSVEAVRTFEEFPLAFRIENAVVAYGLYLWKMVWPARLAMFYPHYVAPPTWQWILSALVLISVTALVVIFRRKRYLPVGWFWFLGTLIPVIGLVQVGDQAMADRYAYVPLIGIFVMIAWGLGDWAEARKVRNFWLVGPAACVLVTLSFATIRQLSSWENEFTVWSHTAAVTDGNPVAHRHMAQMLMDPGWVTTASNLRGLDTEQKRINEARRQYEEELKSYGQRQLAQQTPDTYLPYRAAVFNDLGNLDGRQNSLDEARQHYERALQCYRELLQHDPDKYLPEMATTLGNLSAVDRGENRMDEARQHSEDVLRIYRQLSQHDPDKYLPNMAYTLITLGFLERSQKQPDEAYQHFKEALAIYRRLAQQDPQKYLPAMASRLNNLGTFEIELNRMDEARQHYGEAMTIYEKLAQSDARYAADVARVEVSLKELEKKVPPR